jgi:hypothetical protein
MLSWSSPTSLCDGEKNVLPPLALAYVGLAVEEMLTVISQGSTGASDRP